MNCPCGSGKNYEDCCRCFLKRKALPSSPEALMRSRYVAYVQKDYDYIEQTMTAEALKLFKRKEAEEMGEEIKWLKLEVVSSDEEELSGTVEFRAFFDYKGTKQMMHEISFFKKIDETWMYVQ